MPRELYTTRKQLNSQTKKKFVDDEIPYLHFTIRGGQTIRGLRYVIHKLLTTGHGPIQPQTIPVTIAELETQLAECRQVTQQLQEENRQMETCSFKCDICYEQYNHSDHDKQPLALMCGHLLCQGCFRKWVETQNRECHICREESPNFIPIFW
ncbi:hypothetical protein BKA69DRAFT_1122960 [Paraphysoderma sedebokerense]|nr:hypothetical protein BKA69DRAFT_1122960 [Paraphysoderma sedebokerense]